MDLQGGDRVKGLRKHKSTSYHTLAVNETCEHVKHDEMVANLLLKQSNFYLENKFPLYQVAAREKTLDNWKILLLFHPFGFLSE